MRVARGQFNLTLCLALSTLTLCLRRQLRLLHLNSDTIVSLLA